MNLEGVAGWKVFLGAVGFQYVRYMLLTGAVHYLFWGLFRTWTETRKNTNGRFSRADMLREARASFWFIATLSVPLAFLAMPQHRHYTSLYFDASERPLWWLPVTFVLLMVGQDAYFYWTHRLMHGRLLYPLVHSLHHRSIYPSAFAAFAMHPGEAVIAVGFNLLFVLFVPTHFGVFAVYQTVAFALNLAGHMGADVFPDSWKHTLGLRHINRPYSHAAHHRYTNVNFGLYFTWWDRWMGTFDGRERPIDADVTSPAEAECSAPIAPPRHRRRAAGTARRPGRSRTRRPSRCRRPTR
jgi:sterol desaturase/sphingolipid hydroxylase (fatty acid hydroxylase superfamily)